MMQLSTLMMIQFDNVVAVFFSFDALKVDSYFFFFVLFAQCNVFVDSFIPSFYYDDDDGDGDGNFHNFFFIHILFVVYLY